MATGTRALTLKLIADIDDFNKNLNKGSTEVEGFGGKIEKFGKVAAAAFAAAAAAAAAYAGKLAIDGVKAAIEDEAAQVRLAAALENATGATRDQIAAVEQQITKTALATGVADDQLRPALQRLALSTGDTAKAQELLNLALDVSKATGKPLEAVANSLGRAYDGNTTALGKLGIGLSAAELKTMSFTDVQNRLSDLFGGAAGRTRKHFKVAWIDSRSHLMKRKKLLVTHYFQLLKDWLTLLSIRLFQTFKSLPVHLTQSSRQSMTIRTHSKDCLTSLVIMLFQF